MVVHCYSVPNKILFILTFCHYIHRVAQYSFFWKPYRCVHSQNCMIVSEYWYVYHTFYNTRWKTVIKLSESTLPYWNRTISSFTIFFKLCYFYNVKFLVLLNTQRSKASLTLTDLNMFINAYFQKIIKSIKKGGLQVWEK